MEINTIEVTRQVKIPAHVYTFTQDEVRDILYKHVRTKDSYSADRFIPEHEAEVKLDWHPVDQSETEFEFSVEVSQKV